MDILTKEEFLLRKEQRFAQLRKGALFVYPTDTIYGIGCDATDEKAVQKIRKLKERSDAPFSVIAPGKEWVLQHCEVSPLGEEWLNKLPGTYTIVYALKDQSCVAAAVLGSAETLGIRIPRHWISKIVEEYGRPIVTTSVNKRGKDFLVSPEQLSEEFRDAITFCIDEGKLEGKPSTVINLTGEGVEVVHR